MTASNLLARTAVALAVALLAGCGALVDRAATRFAEDLEAAVVDYDEPLVVERGLPAFLLILEARVEADPDSPETRLAAARLTGTYAGLFVDEPDVARRLAERALDHAERGACLSEDVLCGMTDLRFNAFEARLADMDRDALEPAYALATAWTGWIAAASDDYSALADLPQVERLLEWVAERDPDHDDGNVWLYLAVLNSQRPPAAGGRPDRARDYFRRALDISEGRNLIVKVFMADEYARLLFDRDLFVRLLDEVLAADPRAEGYTLANRVAQQRARALRERTAEIFD
ncbi:MAG: TRAP transporter TatT component family protein [Wenzhouxiangellaceae bacterium]|nr:TRAP transporter TatT component family protein [Wenzhouxiangellaceae bacterium]